MSKPKQSKRGDQSSHRQRNGSVVGDQFQPNQGLGSIEDTKPDKGRSKNPGTTGTRADDFDDEEKDENEEEIKIESFDEEEDEVDLDDNK